MIEPSIPPRYRFGFILNTTLGNKTRYLNLRKYAERDTSVHFEWAPVSHYDPDPDSRPWRSVPAGLRMRLFVLQQTLPVMRRLDQLDAVMVHLFEADVILPARRVFKKWPVLFSSTDEAPIVDRATYPLYPDEIKKPVWRQKLRLAIDRIDGVMKDLAQSTPDAAMAQRYRALQEKRSPLAAQLDALVKKMAEKV